MTYITAGGFNNPVVALIIVLQNRKYYEYSTSKALVWSGYEWAMVFGPVLGAIMAGFYCMFMKEVYKKVHEDSKAEFLHQSGDSSMSIDAMLATSMYSQGKY